MSDRKKTTETYWAVRIGKRPKDYPYFMVNEMLLPILYHNKPSAVDACVGRKELKAVKVKVVEQ